MVIPKSGNWIGNAAYLSVRDSYRFIIAAGGTLIVLNVFLSILCFSLCDGFMAICYYSLINYQPITRFDNTRRHLIKTLLIQEQLVHVNAENILTCMTPQIFTGRFLTTRCTVILCILLDDWFNHV